MCSGWVNVAETFTCRRLVASGRKVQNFQSRARKMSRDWSLYHFRLSRCLSDGMHYIGGNLGRTCSNTGNWSVHVWQTLLWGCRKKKEDKIQKEGGSWRISRPRMLTSLEPVSVSLTSILWFHLKYTSRLKCIVRQLSLKQVMPFPAQYQLNLGPISKPFHPP